jgi:hypothetical protein
MRRKWLKRTSQHAKTEEGRILLAPPFSSEPIPSVAILFQSHYDSGMLKSVEIVGLRGIAHGQLTKAAEIDSQNTPPKHTPG